MATWKRLVNQIVTVTDTHASQGHEDYLLIPIEHQLGCTKLYSFSYVDCSGEELTELLPVGLSELFDTPQEAIEVGRSYLQYLFGFFHQPGTEWDWAPQKFGSISLKG